jgi:hypothetical protein
MELTIVVCGIVWLVIDIYFHADIDSSNRLEPPLPYKRCWYK